MKVDNMLAVIDREEEEADQALNQLTEEDEETLSLAEGMENMLVDALQLAELRTGSLIALQKADKHQTVELGRRVSTFTSQQDSFDDAASISSYRSYNSKVESKGPVFIQVPKGDPTILTQKSWESIMGLSQASSGDAEDISQLVSPTPKGVVEPILKERKWDKLRNTLEKEKQNLREEQRGFSFGSGLKKKFGTFRKKNCGSRTSNKKSELGEPNDTENICARTEASQDPSEEASPARPVKVTVDTRDAEYGSGYDEGEECSLASHGPENGEEILKNTKMNKRRKNPAQTARHLSEKHVPTSPEEALSLEVVYTADQVLPPFPTTMA